MRSFINSDVQRSDNHERYENLQQNQLRRMKLHSDLQSQQRNHRLGRAAWLQGRWLEISEQERRAQLYNQKLLHDLQRAQDTLDDMVARTEAMNTLRVQYERYLEENFPRWQQRLKDIRVSEQSKLVQKHLKNYIQQLDEEQSVKVEHKPDITAHPLSSNSSDQSHLPASHTLLNTHQTGKDMRQDTARCNPHDHLYLPSTWLTGSQPLNSGLPQNNIPKDYKNFHNNQALNHYLPPYYFLPYDSHHQSHSSVHQKIPSMDRVWQNPWTGISQGLPPTGHFTPTSACWTQPTVINPMAMGMTDVSVPVEERLHCSEPNQENKAKEMLKPPEKSNQRLKHKRKTKECNRPSEPDCRAVHQAVDHEDGGESSAVLSEVVKVQVSGIKDRRKKRRDGKQSHSTASGTETLCSSTVSQDGHKSASGVQTDPKRNKKHQKPSRAAKQETSKKPLTTENNDDAVIQDEEVDGQEESRSQEKTPSHASLDKKDATEQLNQKNSGEEEDTDEGDNSHHLNAKEKTSDREDVDAGEEEKSTGEEEEGGLDDEFQGDEEEGNENVVRNQDDTEPSDGEERVGEGDIPDNIPDSDNEQEEEKTEREIEKKNSSQDELINDTRGTQGRTLKSARKDEKESEVEESDKNITINNNSLKELYAADETEEDDVYYQEIEDDEDDEIVVKQAYPWSKDHINNQPKSHDEDNEDIENLLNPEVNSQTHQENDVEETDQPNDLHSKSGEDDLPKKTVSVTTNEPVESDDEFDHFYD